MDSADTLRLMLSEGDAEALQEWVETLTPGELARTIGELEHDEQIHLMHALGPEAAADLLDDLPDELSADLLEEIPVGQAAAIVEELDSDDRADVLAEMEDEDAAAILDALPPVEAEQARELLSYPSDTAGGVMIKEFVAYLVGTTVGEVLEDLRGNREEYGYFDVRYFYVTDQEGVLKGVLRLRDLVLSSPELPIEKIMIPSPRVVNVDDDLQSLQYLLETNHFSALPVVDNNGQILGVVIEKEVLEAARKRMNKTLLRLAGVLGGEELRSMPLLPRAMRRFCWLLLIMGLSFVAASVIAVYESTLQQMIALAVFLPIVSNMTGCAGNQSIALSMREMTIGVINPLDLMYVALNEVKVGLLNGVALGVILGVVGYLWKGMPELGVIVGLALMLNTIVGVCLGGTLPLLLKRLRLDPAIASGPILTTILDTGGFFIVLSLAALSLKWFGAGQGG